MDVETLIKQQVIEVAQNVERQIDSELEKLENMGADDIEKLRVDRLKQLKEEQRKRQEYLAAVSRHVHSNFISIFICPVASYQ